MRSATPSALLVLLLAFAASKADDKKADAVPIRCPQGQLALAVTDLATQVPVEEAPFIKYLSFIAVPPKEADAVFEFVFRFALNHTSGAKSLVRIEPVPGSAGTLARLNIRHVPNWTRAAWEVVGNRDYLFREPLLPHRETQFLRLATGVKQDAKTLAAVSLINAYQLFREMIEADRSPTYYDLLYGDRRHPDGAVQFQAVPKPVEAGPEPVKPAEIDWEGGIWPLDGQFYAKGAFKYTKKSALEQWEKDHAAWKLKKASADLVVIPVANVAGKGDANFPAKGADFEKRWGGEVNAADIKNFLVDPRFGGIATGRDNDRKNGSFVAGSDRAIQIVGSSLTPGGWVARTHDVFANAGDKDHMERFLQIARGDAKADGGELLASLPNGAQAALLVNEKDERVEIANSKLAQVHGEIDPRFKDVRTVMSCVVCHGASNGFISFNEAVQKSIRAGLQAKQFDAAVERELTDFYTRWERGIKMMQEPYRLFLLDITATKENPQGWTAAQMVKEFLKARDEYDDSVNLDTAARELGLDRKELHNSLLGITAKLTAMKKDGVIEPFMKKASERAGRTFKFESVSTRLNQLATEQSIGRKTWEADTAFTVILFLDLLKPQEEPIKRLLAEDLYLDAVKKFGIKQ